GSGRLRLSVLSEDRLQMKWKEAEGLTSGYKVLVKPMAGDPEQEVMLKTKTPKVTVGGLDPGKEYILQIHVIQGTQDTLIAKKRFIIEDLKALVRNSRKKPEEGTPVPRISGTLPSSPSAGTVPERVAEKEPLGVPDTASQGSDGKRMTPPTTALTPKPTQRSPPKAEKEMSATPKTSKKGLAYQCDTVSEWDIVLLVDSSWSVGRANFRLVKNFLGGILSPLNISRDRIRIGTPLFLPE
ncbi:hypothetical protein FKM82_021961, partial [Ascaphus truei]